MRFRRHLEHANASLDLSRRSLKRFCWLCAYALREPIPGRVIRSRERYQSYGNFQGNGLVATAKIEGDIAEISELQCAMRVFEGRAKVHEAGYIDLRSPESRTGRCQTSAYE